MTPAEAKQKLIDDFSMLTDWMDKYDYLIELGKTLPKLDDNYKVEDNKIAGCQSDVWMRAYTDNGKIFFEADAGAIITKGLMALLINVYSGQPFDDVIQADMDFIEQIGLRDQLTPTRSNGLLAMLKEMKNCALMSKAQAN
jgi:cysteine desulfuration protein SufE